jgi:hypothetical protein
MVPNCLSNIIGVRCLVGSETPISGHYINDLEGLNLRYAAAITDEQSSGLLFLKSKIDFATSLVLSDLSAFLMPYFRANSIMDEIRVGEWGTNNLAPAGVTVQRGVKIKIKKSRLMRIRIQTINIRMAQTNTPGNLLITDGVDLTTIPFTTDGSGMATLNLAFLSSTNEVTVTIDNDTFGMNNTVVKNGCNCSTKNSEFLTANGWNGSSFANTTYGLQVQANGECSMDDMACILGVKLALPILYRSGLEIVKEAKTTDRLNSLTLLDDEKAEFMFTEFTSQYQIQMKNLMATIPELMKRVDDCCVVCNQSRYVEGRP